MRVAGAAALPAYVTERGGVTARVLHDAGVEAAELADPQAWMEIDRLGALHEAAALELDDPDLGIRFGRTIPLHAYGLLSYIVLNAPTVETALLNLVRLATHLTAPALKASLRTERGLAILEFMQITDAPDDCRQYIESSGALLWMVLRALAGPQWKPTEIRFQHGKGASERNAEALFEAPIRYRCRANCLLFPAADLRTVVVSADRNLLPIVEKRVAELLAAASDRDDGAAATTADPLVFAVREEIARCLCDGQPELVRVARRMAMSSRSLQRRLGERGLRFKRLVRDTRHELACEYLQHSELSVTEIALLLGYAQLSVFDRAFRAVADMSPSRWRRMAAGALIERA